MEITKSYGSSVLKEMESAGWALLPAVVYLMILSPFQQPALRSGGTINWLMLWVFLAAGYDISSRRIPNVLSLTALLTGICWSFYSGGAQGLLNGILGFFTGFSIMFILYLLGMTGGGDVKIIAALSAYLSPVSSVYLIISIFICGGIYAVFTLIFSGKISQLNLIFGEFRNFRIVGTGLKRPYGIAIAMGVMALAVVVGIPS
jgi:prepilin peptidase CpaA